ncbi:hypothetical protein HLB23_11535 [Nocardia uniformis]|uniref:Uncharacterized protein n=1 Tax=Nocardia uniformis TaxID=53432 RepID=A0A849C3Z5_9NOCA|nr:hypothetical protein [Nocardia uniformis]NNH70487.1 hypothetical protein [Nocardia uniformis]
MRTRIVTITLTAAAGVTAAALIGAGSAAAATPLVGPGAVGVDLSPGETAALASGPVPALVDQVVPYDATWVALAPGSQLADNDAWRFAPLRDIIGETVEHPDGHVALIVSPGDGLGVIQDW